VTEAEAGERVEVVKPVKHDSRIASWFMFFLFDDGNDFLRAT
jgi:hypothetical protein